MKRLKIHSKLLTASVMLSLLLASGCTKDPVSSAQTNNPSVKLDLLFEQDGCKMYRFKDEGSSHYWANCPGTVSSTQRAGKSSRPVEITTTESDR